MMDTVTDGLLITSKSCNWTLSPEDKSPKLECRPVSYASLTPPSWNLSLFLHLISVYHHYCSKVNLVNVRLYFIWLTEDTVGAKFRTVIKMQTVYWKCLL